MHRVANASYDKLDWLRKAFDSFKEKAHGRSTRHCGIPSKRELIKAFFT
jgi:hypothetical protein